MEFLARVAEVLFGGLLLGGCAWAATKWPGREDWARAAISRLIWWAWPFSAIVLLHGVSWDHALYLGAAAYLGAWAPHTHMPDLNTHWKELAGDVAISVLRAGALLAPPTAVFYACGAFWFAMFYAIGAVFPSIIIAHKVPPRWLGLQTGWQVGSVFFATVTGICVSAAISIEVPVTDYLP